MTTIAPAAASPVGPADAPGPSAFRHGAQGLEALLAAARAKYAAGALDAALGLLVAVEAGPPDALRAAEVEHLRGQIAALQRRSGDGARLLLSAARRLERLDAALARETSLEALAVAVWAGHRGLPGGVRAAAEAARAAPPAPGPPRVADVLLDAFALRLTEGYAAAAPTMARAVELVLGLDAGTDLEADRGLWLAGAGASQMAAQELWDAESWHTLAARMAQFARDTGALVLLQFGLNFLAVPHLLAGELATAARLIEEDRLIAEATGNPPAAYTAMTLAAWRGREAPATELIETTVQEATARGQGRLVSLADYASAVLGNGLGRHDAARDAAWRAFQRDPVGYGPFIVPELAEAASRTGDLALVRAALDWLAERTAVTPGDWSLGSKPASGPSLPRARPPSASTASRSTAWAGPACAPSSPARTCSTASGCAAGGAAPTPARNCAPPTRCWTRWASGRSPSGPAASWRPPGRPPASAPWRPAAS